MRSRSLCALALMLLPTLALAHPGDHSAGFFDGLVHPLTGLDHVLAIVAAGLLSGRMSRSARWLVPLTFVSMMVAGAFIGTAAGGLPATEVMIVVSVAALGLAVSAPQTLGLAAAMVLVGCFALFHGYAHGAEAPGGGFAAFVAGFCVSTTGLLTAGVAAVSIPPRALPTPVLRLLGRIMLIASVALVIRMI